jgi:hypothetical protein
MINVFLLCRRLSSRTAYYDMRPVKFSGSTKPVGNSWPLDEVFMTIKRFAFWLGRGMVRNDRAPNSPIPARKVGRNSIDDPRAGTLAMTLVSVSERLTSIVDPAMPVPERGASASRRTSDEKP